ncbi:hypothetical protein CV770_26720 [Bradyrhizobium sp. AC87j1]|nr:hypothetical protein CV770_26720 [Bradyrhizobium sp. AC87j1]
MGVWYFAPGELEADHELVELFRAFKYDIKNPQHWRWLLGQFAKMYFGKGRGRPKKWTVEAKSRLFLDWIMLGREQRGLKLVKTEDVSGQLRAHAKLLKERHSLDPLYHGTSADEIYKNLLKVIKERRQKTTPKKSARKAVR